MIRVIDNAEISIKWRKLYLKSQILRTCETPCENKFCSAIHSKQNKIMPIYFACK